MTCKQQLLFISEGSIQVKRRLGVLLSTLTVAALVLAACGNNSTNEPANNSSQPSPSNTVEQTADAQVEIFSWWTGAGEEAGLQGLIQLFSEKHPDIEVINAAVAGGAGTNAKAVLTSRMQGGDPPDSFQVHGGAELNTGWVAAEKVIGLNDLFEEEGWHDKFPKELIDLVSDNGKAYSVPVNIHRGNVIFYNKKIFDDNKLTAPTTFDEFYQVADALIAKGITPLALGDKEPWTATMLLENILLG